MKNSLSLNIVIEPHAALRIFLFSFYINGSVRQVHVNP